MQAASSNQQVASTAGNKRHVQDSGCRQTTSSSQARLLPAAVPSASIQHASIQKRYQRPTATKHHQCSAAAVVRSQQPPANSNALCVLKHACNHSLRAQCAPSPIRCCKHRSLLTRRRRCCKQRQAPGFAAVAGQHRAGNGKGKRAPPTGSHGITRGACRGRGSSLRSA